MAQLIDGKALAQTVRNEVQHQVDHLKSLGINPGLAVILVGENPASQIYVRNKQKACHAAGINSFEHHLAANTSQSQLLELITQLNEDPKVHGILVQLPLPNSINEDAIIEHIAVEKDVDGFHPISMGRLLSGLDGLRPCTPLGVMRMLKSTKVALEGKHAVVVGRSNIVGKPMAQLLLQANATVTICHSRTQNIQEMIRQADIIVAAVGKPNFIKGEWIKKGAIAIDVGMNRLANGKLAGDIDFTSAQTQCAYITPVPGGVGPMTIAMLLKNTITACQQITGNNHKKGN